jgi:hypothetical protein
MKFQYQIRENGNRPHVQQAIAEAAIKGAKDAGVEIFVSAQNGSIANSGESDVEWEDVMRSAQDRVDELEIED